MSPRALPRRTVTLDVEALEALVDARIDARADELASRAIAKIIGALAAPTKPAEYTSHGRGPRPSGWALRPWQRAIKGIPGAVRRGRYHVISRDDFKRWEAGKAGRSVVAAPWDPDAALASVGLSVAGGRR